MKKIKRNMSQRKLRQFERINEKLQKCSSCPYFSINSIINTDYYVDEDGVKHRDIKYVCYYDTHEIKTSVNVCPRGTSNV